MKNKAIDNLVIAINFLWKALFYFKHKYKIEFGCQFQDRYAERNGYPVEDSSQDVQLLSGSEVNGVTTIKFTRKHNTCDDKDMVVGVR